MIDGVGVIDPGYEGSFVVLDRDIFTINPEDIDQVQVAETCSAENGSTSAQPTDQPGPDPDRRQIDSPLPDRS
ncbi:hypothetical protein ACVBEQ_21765 [Nakamurella sp. GG22]